MLRLVANAAWRCVAYLVSRRPVADYLIRSAQRTPYFHLPGYMNRWWLFNGYSSDTSLSPGERDATKRFRWLPSIRVHHILRADTAAHVHDHPWNARTIILRGNYTERRLERGLHTLLEWLPVWHEREPGSTARVLFGEYHHIEKSVRAGPSPSSSHGATAAFGASWSMAAKSLGASTKRNTRIVWMADSGALLEALSDDTYAPQRIAESKLGPCIPCMVWAGLGKMPSEHVIVGGDYHHCKSGNLRRGDRYGFCNCAWHHRRVPFGNWSIARTAAHFGPSLMDGSTLFHETYGDDDTLILIQDHVLVLIEKGHIHKAQERMYG